MKVIIHSFTWAAILLATACSKTHQNEKGTVEAFTEAAHRVQALKSEGNLPGFTKKDTGIIRSHGILPDSKVEYPLRVSMQLEKAEDKNEAIYWYTLEKGTEGSDWKIIEAWKTDFRGENRRELIDKQ